ncbi:solute carrier organic anion transporter family member 2A1-like [Anthonomus grandis grandis]|uniref:solute carrier organic anion transporter family member 2A1-like n=1 Tax=Anthonomus grandis grandis TaxID=2921223 RepID=UPI0021664EE7|nr:solute carrier organic anion transporter family member 2A1-like [Anthonomus grandis grandis]
MVHHTELLRTNSLDDEAGSFVAPVGDYRNDVDCGCKALPCLTERLNLEKIAKPTIFVSVLSFAGFLNGVIVKYFRGTSQVWSQHYGIPQDTTEWIIYINEVFVGFFALIVAYWGNRNHRPKWLGTLTIYLAVFCIILVIPEGYLPYNKGETDIDVVNGKMLCTITTKMEINVSEEANNNQKVAFAILILYQIIYALYTISFITHGITYIDDNISPGQVPVSIATVFATQRMGKQAGIYKAWIPFVFNTQSVFVSVGWLLVASFLLIAGILLAMFPKVMPGTLLRKSVNSLLSIASGNAVVEPKQQTDGFSKTLWRILKNKILLLNIIAMMFMQAAIINFNIKEKDFNQSKYHVSKYNDISGYSDPTLIQFTTNLLKQPVIAISYITVGVVISKVKPCAKYLVLWNIKIFVVVLLGFVGIRFFNCTTNLQNQIGGKLTIPYCSWNCGCLLDGPFQPVCLNGGTHYSPCWAGCTDYDSSLKLFGNCTCGGSGRSVATEGSCDADSCSTLWALAQTHGVVSSALLGTAFIVSIIITLRCVETKDKALALGLYLTFISLIPYLPMKAIYDAIGDNFCQSWGRQSCLFYSEGFGLLLAINTICLKVLAILTLVALYFVIGKVELFTNKNSRAESDEDLSYLRRPGVVHQTVPIANNNNLQSSSLEEPGVSAQNPSEISALIHNPTDILRNKQRSESKLDKAVNRSSKSNRINSYLSEGDLVPPLNSNLKLKSPSRTSNSNNSVISSDSSLSAIANAVGDDHDSDFSTLQRPGRVKVLPTKLSPKLNARNGKPNLQETEF